MSLFARAWNLIQFPPMSNRLLTLLRASRDIQQTQRLDREAMLAVQERRWRAMVRHALNVSPFYRRRLAGLDPEHCALSDIPPLTKPELLEHWDEIVADPRLQSAPMEKYVADPSNWSRLFHNRWMVCRSSGTTGLAITFPQPVEALDWMHAAHYVRNGTSANEPNRARWYPGRPRQRLVSIACMQTPCASSGIYNTRPWVGDLFLKHHLLDVGTPWPEMIEQLNRIQPQVLAAFASVLSCLARAQLDGQLHLDFSGPRACIFSGGDGLTPGIRALCRKAFGIEPLNGYGSTETTTVARQLRGTDHLMLMEDLVVYEPVDEHERPVAEGELSHHALVTPLINRDVPLLRYRISDRARPGPIQPGWPFRTLIEVLGRTAMTFTFRVPEPRRVNGVDLMRAWYDDTRVVEYQLRQLSPSVLHVAFIPQPGEDGAALASELSADLRALLDEAGCRTVRCDVVPVPDLEKHPLSGKVERFIPLNEE